MSNSPRLIAILDACVIYPAPIRDVLLNLADLNLYAPKWSKAIQDEWVRNLLANRPDLKKESLERTVHTMNAAFPDAEVQSFEPLIEVFDLPDPKDRHVLAAGIKSNANVIITFNIKDFPKNRLQSYHIEVHTPDTFIQLLNDLDSQMVNKAFENQLNSLKNPPLSKEELIQALEKCGLRQASKFFT